MQTSFYTAGTATVQSQRGLDVLANNIANVSTTGFKTQSPAFSDLLYTNMNYDNDDLKIGHGARLAKADTIFGVGAMNTTGRELDFALTETNAFFAVRTNEGVKFTRDGGFIMSEQQDGTFHLATGDGFSILGVDGQPIVIDPNEKLSGLQTRIGVYSFDNIDGLERAGSNRFNATERSGEAYLGDNSCVEQGMLEASAVDYADQITNVIKSQRAFQFNARMVQISDEIMQTVNNMR